MSYHLSRLNNIKVEHVPFNNDFSYDRVVASIRVKAHRFAHITDFLEADNFGFRKTHEEAFVLKPLVSWYADYIIYLVVGVLPLVFTYHHKKKFFHDLKHYY